MNYFDIFRIAYDDLTLIALNPHAIVTSVKKTDAGYVGEILVLGEYPDRDSDVLFFHENGFSSEQEAYSDLDKIIETINVAFRNTKQSEAIVKNYLPE